LLKSPESNLPVSGGEHDSVDSFYPANENLLSISNNDAANASVDFLSIDKSQCSNVSSDQYNSAVSETISSMSPSQRDMATADTCVVQCYTAAAAAAISENDEKCCFPLEDSEGKTIPHIDWSRSARNKLALLKSACDPNQTRITSFCDLIENVNAILSEIPAVSNAIQEVTTTRSVDFPPLFKCLIENAEKNLVKAPHQVRYNTLLKKFATSLAIYGGPMTYNFIASNLSRALPNLRTVQRYIAAEYTPFEEGVFRFDELLVHLNSYNAAKVVSLGEDATRVVSRVEYDVKTDKLVGFVLPCNDEGLPICDSFLATSFETLETYFKRGSVAKYAFVYMAQPLTVGVPAFCLACMGTDNRFNADIVANRWKYIYDELSQRGISLVSVGADGDSRELRAMQVSTHLLSSQKVPNLLSIGKSIHIPSDWKAWFAMKHPTTVACIQDVVHIAVKLKTRLLKPSILLPLGDFAAGVHDLRTVQQMFTKDQHGLRERDINFKDKQNYDAVLRMTSDSTINLLKQIPTAKGTVVYLEMLKSFNDSFLDMSLSYLERVKKAWYSVFTLRYWRQWIILHSRYSVRDNFVSANSYMCTELNAHSLIVHALSLQMLAPSENISFLPWLLGSQCCEKLFRVARSMSSTFSTVINFGVLGLLQRLNRLQIQIKLESECDQTKIKYPRVEAHRKKDGHSKTANDSCNIQSVTKEEILSSVLQALAMAKVTIEDLGMAKLLQSKDNWDYPPIPGCGLDVGKEDDVDDSEDIEEYSYLQEENLEVSAKDVTKDIAQLSNINIIEDKLKEQLDMVHKVCYKKINDTGLPMYQPDADLKSKAPSKDTQICRFVEVHYNQKKVHIHKTTAVWLLQEGERVSPDRMFRVRARQPFSVRNKPSLQMPESFSTLPIVCSTIQVGGLCVFVWKRSHTISWKIGRVLQFVNRLEKTKGAQQYRGLYANVDDKKVGVLCSWYTSIHNSTREFSIISEEAVHDYLPLCTYLCTLSYGCIEQTESAVVPQGIGKTENGNHDAKLVTSKHFFLKEGAVSVINNLFQDYLASTTDIDTSQNPGSSLSVSKGKKSVVTIADDGDHNETAPAGRWLICGKIELSKQDKQHILGGKELTDLHINAFQSLARQQYPDVGGLYNTLVVGRAKFVEGQKQFLQILHVQERAHWIAIYILNSEVYLYDSMFTSASNKTLEIVAQILQTKQPHFTVNYLNVSRQAGTTDCGLYTIAAVTCILQGEDPTKVAFDQKALRLHLVKILEAKSLSAFPVVKTRRVAERISKTEQCEVHCLCRLPDNGEKMILCDHCDEWFHLACVKIDEPLPDTWYCDDCSNKVMK